MTLFSFTLIEGGIRTINRLAYESKNSEAAIAEAVVEARAAIARRRTNGVLDMNGSIEISAYGGIPIATVTFDQAVLSIR